jgi:hypothetical protein
MSAMPRKRPTPVSGPHVAMGHKQSRLWLNVMEDGPIRQLLLVEEQHIEAKLS